MGSSARGAPRVVGFGGCSGGGGGGGERREGVERAALCVCVCEARDAGVGERERLRIISDRQGGSLARHRRRRGGATNGRSDAMDRRRESEVCESVRELDEFDEGGG